MTLALLLASLSWAQSTPTVNALSLPEQLSLSNLGKAVRDLEAGYYIQTGKPVFKNGICFDVGRTDCQTAAASSSVRKSTWVNFSDQYTTTSASWVSFARSTLTFTTTRDGRLQIVFNCLAANSSRPSFVAVGATIDEQFFNGQTGTIGLGGSNIAVADEYQWIGFNVTTTDSYAAGSHKAVLHIKRSVAGTAAINRTDNLCQYRFQEALIEP